MVLKKLNFKFYLKADIHLVTEKERNCEGCDVVETGGAEEVPQPDDDWVAGVEVVVLQAAVRPHVEHHVRLTQVAVLWPQSEISIRLSWV